VTSWKMNNFNQKDITNQYSSIKINQVVFFKNSIRYICKEIKNIKYEGY
jgi:hypothetical protein